MHRPLVISLAVAALLSGCAGGTDHEHRGDQAYVASEFPTALGEYRLAIAQDVGNLRLRSKAAQAALNAGELMTAVEQFLEIIARSDSGDAFRLLGADGLELVARTAADEGNNVALQASLEGLRAIAEARAVGEFGTELSRNLGDDPAGEEALTLLPYAAAVAPDVARQDSLMFLYATAMRREGRCGPAAEVFEAITRRRRNPSLEESAREGATSCLYRLGERLLDRGRPEAAEEWFVRTVAVPGESRYRRAAYVGIGDVRLALGDYIAAQSAYEQAREGLTESDSLYHVVQRRINALFDAGTVFRQ